MSGHQANFTKLAPAFKMKFLKFMLIKIKQVIIMQAIEYAILIAGAIVAGAASATSINSGFSAHVDAIRDSADMYADAIVEKITVLHYEQSGTTHSFIISNYGNSEITIIDIVDNNMGSLDCTFTDTLDAYEIGHIICYDVSALGIFIETSNDNTIKIATTSMWQNHNKSKNIEKNSSAMYLIDFSRGYNN